MGDYRSPGVYVEEVPSAEKPIAGVGTSTPVFIGVVPDNLIIPIGPVSNERVEVKDGTLVAFPLKAYVLPGDKRFQVRVNGAADAKATFADDDTKRCTVITLSAPPGKAEVVVDYTAVGKMTTATAGEVKLCTNFGEFAKFFGGFSTDNDQRNLALGVYGFFNNGGSSCYAVRQAADKTAISPKILEKLAAIDDIALVVAPGLTDTNVRSQLITHCQQTTASRFAILDSAEVVETDGSLDLTLLDVKNANRITPPFSDYAGFYFPWIQVMDPVKKILDPDSKGLAYVPPSGHIAGVFARVDTQRGVHKAPANEVVMGALGIKYRLSKGQQDRLNPTGVNCIRDLNGNIRIWGARTMGGDANADLKYINVRRTLIYLRGSIEGGTQWVVFEPNNPQLWAKVRRNITAFLTNVWRQGALFGNSPAEAFFVKCDAETNPPELRDLGQVVTEIGVSIVRPAEFVIFRISQWSGPGK